MIDVEAYDAVRRRLEPLLSVTDPRHTVPACPGWSVGDVLAHLVGLCEDWVEGRFDGYASDEWTAAHLERHRGESCASLLERWRATMRAFAAVDESPLGATPARWAFGDAVVHEADLRGATSSGRVPDDCGGARLAGRTGALAGRVLRQAGLGRGARRPPRGAGDFGRARPSHGIENEVGVDAYEVFRGLAGRRSVAQVAGVVVVGGSGPLSGRRAPIPVPVGPDPDRRLKRQAGVPLIRRGGGP